MQFQTLPYRSYFNFIISVCLSVIKSKEMENGDAIIRSENGDRKGWWARRTKNQKKGIFCTSGFFLTLIICLAVYFIIFADKTVICKTPECHAISSQIRNFIDERYKPCDDFYRFACGTFLSNTSFDDTHTIQSVTLMMQEEIQSDISKMLSEEIDPEDIPSLNLAKKFYKACMNEQAIERAGVKQLEKLFKQMGGWPILEGENWDADKFEWTKAVRNLRTSGVNVDFFFNVTVDVDREHPEKYVLGIHDRFYSPSEISANSKATFLDYMVQVTSQFNVKVWNLKQEQSNVLDFLLNLGKISQESKKSNKTDLYNPYSLIDLQNEFFTIPWIEYLQGILGTSTQLRLDDIINVSEPVYLKKLELLLKRTDKRVIANFMGWHIVQSLINYLPSRILDRAYDYLKKVNGHFYRKPRWSVCVEATRDRLSGPINVGYIERYFDDENKYSVIDLIRNVKKQFRKNLLGIDWLDKETKKQIMTMLVSSLEKIYSDLDFLNVVQEYYSVNIEEDKLLKAVLDLDLIIWNAHYNSLRQQVKDDWIKTQTFISGLKVTYSATDNVLKFPLGLFRGMYYNKNRPDYMNYGLLGTVLAHQISHIFVEAEGVLVAESKIAQQRLLNWWSSISLKQYMEKLECLSNQYEKFEIRDVDNLRPNAVITRDEDIADLAGLKIAYDTYIEKERNHGRDPLLPGLKYNSRQLFWISSALQFCSKYPVTYLKVKYSGNRYHHSPNEFRVNGPLRNLEQFSYDFRCPRDSYMNPQNKCHIW